MVLAVGVLLASVVSVEFALSVASIEIILGVVAGNTLHLSTPQWLVFLAAFGSIVLTFLAGAEVDPDEFRSTWRASTLIGVVSFALPVAGAMVTCRHIFGWSWPAAQIGGLALSTPSFCVLYFLLVETGLNRARVGKLVVNATFVTNLCAVVALSVLFIEPTWWLVPFVGGSLALIVIMPRLGDWFFRRYGDRVTEPEIKGAFAALLLMMWLAERAHSHAILPAFLLGLAVSRTFTRHPATQRRFRVAAFALLTPFFFFRSGMNVSLELVIGAIGMVAVMFAVKLAFTWVGVYPLARRYAGPHATFTTLLLSTGLTFGTIFSTYGYTAGIVDKAQFSVLATVVVLSAVVPTVIAQRFFLPTTTPQAVTPAGDVIEGADAFFKE
jgi:Kef-type K+ transport system membrane component KefB